MSLFSSTELNAFDSFLADLVATDQSVLHPFPSLTGTTPCSTTTNNTTANFSNNNNNNIDLPPDHYVLSSPNTSIWADRQYPWTYRTRPDLADRASVMEKSKSSSIPYETYRSYASLDFDCAPRLPEYIPGTDVTRWTVNAGADQSPTKIGAKESEGLEANLTNLPAPATYLNLSPPPVPPPPPVEPYIDSALSSSYRPTSAHMPAYTPPHPSLLDARQAASLSALPRRQRPSGSSVGRPDDNRSSKPIPIQPKLGPPQMSSCSGSSSSSSSTRQTPCLDMMSRAEDRVGRRQSSASPGLLTATQKRANHIHSEKKRRETIKKRTEALCRIVPSLRALCFIKEEQEEEMAGAAAAAAKESSRDNEDGPMGNKRKKPQKTAGRRGRRSEEDRERLSFKIGGPKSEKIILIKTIEHLRILQADRHRLLTRLDDLRKQGLANGIPADMLETNRPLDWDAPWKMTEREDGEDESQEAV